MCWMMWMFYWLVQKKKKVRFVSIYRLLFLFQSSCVFIGGCCFYPGVRLWLEMMTCCFWASLVGVKLYRWSRGRLSINSGFGAFPAKTLQWRVHWFYFSEILKSWQCHCNNAHGNKVTSGFYTVLLTLVVWFLQNLDGSARWNYSV